MVPQLTAGEALVLGATTHLTVKPEALVLLKVLMDLVHCQVEQRRGVLVTAVRELALVYKIAHVLVHFLQCVGVVAILIHTRGATRMLIIVCCA